MFEDFDETTIDTGDAAIHVRRGGSGPPLLLLHGYPQTGVMWHAVAPLLAETFTLVVPDLRGYGRSSRPRTTADHWPYTKRAMARDQVAVMRALGFETFAVCGHDRGARCAYRLALDHPERVTRLAVLDIIPTADHWRHADAAFGRGYWHWYFLAAPAPVPERMIAAAPDDYYGSRGGMDAFTPEALQEYRRWGTDPETVHAMCEDYRAAATLDYEHDERDRTMRRRIACPVLALWGARNFLDEWYDVLGHWRAWSAADVGGRALACGHYLPEELPEETAAELREFFAAST
jgi:haloacetate dehalogenase